jgi:hypothetical protein
MPLIGIEAIKVRLPYENGETLEKSKFNIIDEAMGKFEIELDDFEIQGLKVGDKQTFTCDIYTKDSLVKVAFVNGLNVKLINDRKQLK